MDITLVLVTLLSLLVAAVMTAFAWRLAQEERRREQARVSALAAEIHLEDWPLRTAESGVGDVTLSNDLFSDTQAARHPSRANIGIVIATLLAAGVAIVTVTNALRARPSAHVAAQATRAQTQPAVAAPARANKPSAIPAETGVAAAPLELTALTHERDADHLTVRGIIINPASRPALDRLSAVVAVFDRDGNPVGDTRAAIDTQTLAPGSAASFVVSIPNAANVARYRISFRIDDGVIPHVDRRSRAITPAKQP